VRPALHKKGRGDCPLALPDVGELPVERAIVVANYSDRAPAEIEARQARRADAKKLTPEPFSKLTHPTQSTAARDEVAGAR